MSRIKNPPRSTERFIWTPTPGWIGARPRGGNEYFRRMLASDHAANCRCFECYDPTALVTSPPDARAELYLRLKARRPGHD